MVKKFLSFISAALLAGAGGSCVFDEVKSAGHLKPLEQKVLGSNGESCGTINTRIGKLNNYVNSSWYESDHSFWGSAVEQLAGSAKSLGIVDLFAEMNKYPFEEKNGWREWQGADAVYRYKLDGQRHNFTVEANNGSFSARYEVGVNENSSPWVIAGEVFKKIDEMKTGWAYSIGPEYLVGDKKEKPILVRTSRLDGYIGSQPLWRSRERKNDHDVYTAQPQDISALKNKWLNTVFK